MKCPVCGGRTWVYKTEHEPGAVVRIRVCEQCGGRFITKEVMERSGEKRRTAGEQAWRER